VNWLSVYNIHPRCGNTGQAQGGSKLAAQTRAVPKACQKEA
jgi:hypothetical protein